MPKSPIRRSKLWTAEEDAILVASAHLPTEELAATLKRSPEAVRKRLLLKGLGRHRNWRDSDTEVFRAFAAAGLTAPQIALKMDFDDQTIRNKSVQLSIPVAAFVSPNHWTDDEVATLQRMCADHTVDEIAVELDRERQTVASKIAALRLSTPRPGDRRRRTVAMVKEGYSIQEIAAALRLRWKPIRKFCRQSGIGYPPVDPPRRLARRRGRMLQAGWPLDCIDAEADVMLAIEMNEGIATLEAIAAATAYTRGTAASHVYQLIRRGHVVHAGRSGLKHTYRLSEKCVKQRRDKATRNAATRKDEPP